MYSTGVVILEVFNGMLVEEKERAALKKVQELRDKMGSKKPLPLLLRGLLASVPQDRLSASDALANPLFSKLSTSEPRLVHSAVSDSASLGKENCGASGGAKKNRKGKAGGAEAQLRKFMVKYSFTNPLTLHAAKTYHDRTDGRVCPEHCLVLASKLYESDLIDLWEHRYLNRTFNLAKYVDDERIVFEQMNFCLYPTT
mmetsp:Transcript_20819/g.58577  ORF Transcript_20819/g.58577 Transcript_20819/m.58577 type:complete len:199 (+) Transcript_20819:485-1081(+)